jgi:hypothetical protein
MNSSRLLRIILFLSVSFMFGVITMDLVHDLSFQNGSNEDRELIHRHAKFLVHSFDHFTNWATYLVPTFLLMDLFTIIVLYLKDRKVIDLLSLILSIVHAVILFGFHVPSLEALRTSNLQQFASISQQHYQNHLIGFTRNVLVILLQIIMLSKSNDAPKITQKKKK